MSLSCCIVPYLTCIPPGQWLRVVCVLASLLGPDRRNTRLCSHRCPRCTGQGAWRDAFTGVGSDVVPTDCLALHLKQCLPSATHLALAFAGQGPAGLPPGTQRTVIEMIPYGLQTRRDGRLESAGLGMKTRMIDFGGCASSLNKGSSQARPRMNVPRL